MRAFAIAALVAVAFQTQPPLAGARLVGEERGHLVERGDSWTSIGARRGVSPVTLARINGRVPGSRLKPGDAIVVDNRHIMPESASGEILINLPQRLLFHYVDGVLRAHYPIAVGLPDWPTPIGAFTIIEREENPTWDVPVSIQEEMRREGRKVLTKVPPGKDNPLGRHWLRLSFGPVGLHGTNAPLSVYRVTTHGCMRMHPDDVADLFAHTEVGDAGRIIYEPILATVLPDGRVFLEVNPDAYTRVPNMLDLAVDVLTRAGAGGVADPALVIAAVTAHAGIAVDVSVKSPPRARNSSGAPETTAR